MSEKLSEILRKSYGYYMTRAEAFSLADMAEKLELDIPDQNTPVDVELSHGVVIRMYSAGLMNSDRKLGVWPDADFPKYQDKTTFHKKWKLANG